MQASGYQWEVMKDLSGKLAGASHGEKAGLKAQACEALGVGLATLHRWLKESGLSAERKRRSDAGASRLSETELRLIASLLFHSQRDNKKQLMSTATAIDIAYANGQLGTRPSAAHVNRLLRKSNLHPKQLAQQAPAVSLRSLHPNHVWQIDASVCVLYYMRNGSMAVMDRDEFYRNKPENLAKVANDLCTRYAAVDHYSGAFKVRYYTGGETGANLVDFFLYAIAKQPESPMHGVPRHLMLDPGAANKGHVFTNLAKRIDLKPIINRPRNARAKGSVEKTHDIIERHFEGRFRFMPAESLTLEGINEKAERWANHYCSQHRHTRHGKTRNGMWMTIAADQLRVPTKPELLRDLATSRPETRRVDGQRCISFAIKGHGRLTYDLRFVPGVNIGQTVKVTVSPFRVPAIEVLAPGAANEEERWHIVEPAQLNEAGFRDDAPVIGQDIRTAANTPADDQRNRITREAYRLQGYPLPSLEEAKRARKAHAPAYAGKIDALADLTQCQAPAYLPRAGTVAAFPVRRVEVPMLSAVETCKRLRDQLGHAYPQQMFAFVQHQFPDGVPEDQVHTIPEAFSVRYGAGTVVSVGAAVGGGK